MTWIISNLKKLLNIQSKNICHQRKQNYALSPHYNSRYQNLVILHFDRFKNSLNIEFLILFNFPLSYPSQYYSPRYFYFFIKKKNYKLGLSSLLRTWHFQAEKNVVYTFWDQLTIALTTKIFPQATVMKVSCLPTLRETFLTIL